jgi:hypothetical protein
MYGCVLSGHANPQRNHRTSLHESITSVYFTFGFAFRLCAFAILIAGGVFLISCVHRTLLIKLHNWHMRRAQAVQAQESSDEEPEVDPHHTRSDEDELQPLTTADHERQDGQTDAIHVTAEGFCVVCRGPINCVLMRCTHAVICLSCAKKTKNCPKCNVKIHRRQKLFIV